MLSFARLATLSVFAVSALAAPMKRNVEDAAVTSLSNVIDKLTTKLTPVTDALAAITAQEADLLAAVSPLTQELSCILDGAVAEISDLVALPVNEVLAAADGTILSVADVAGIVAPVMVTVIDALNSVLLIAQTTGVTDAVEPVLQTVGAALCPVLSTTAPIVDGLLVAAAPILIPVLGTADILGLHPVLDLVEGVAGSLGL
ncbi:hypothetical protein MKEN_00305600 [Mycena kentingensis (nom. inval.)]|nr:hypothetical protein MKEN_00305600 [Mycena kentingensis (nom. inval.)]